MRRNIRIAVAGALLALTTSAVGAGTAHASDPSDGTCLQSETGTLKLGSDNWLYECEPFNDGDTVGYFWQGY